MKASWGDELTGRNGGDRLGERHEGSRGKEEDGLCSEHGNESVGKDCVVAVVQ